MIILLKYWRLMAAGFSSGWVPKAPGTFGSLASLPFAWWLTQWQGPLVLLLAAGLLTLLGCLACARVLPTMPDQDPGWIVIDEWAGQWLCLGLLWLWLPLTLPVLLLGFMAFRLLDIVKPWPISALEHWGPAWWSIMADDLLAGALGAAMCVLLWPLI